LEASQKNTIIWVVIIASGAYAVNKFRSSLGFGSSFNPSDTSVISSVWNDTASNHKRYTYTIHAGDASNLSEDIYKSFGAFGTDFNKMFADFAQCKTQGDVFQVCQLFENNYDVNLWQSMINGFGLYPLSGLSNAQLKEVNDYVIGLPL
jgi:hypothetical protein